MFFNYDELLDELEPEPELELDPEEPPELLSPLLEPPKIEKLQLKQILKVQSPPLISANSFSDNPSTRPKLAYKL